MKHTIKTLTVAMTLALLFAACERENTGFEPGTEPSKPSVVDEMGYISFNGGELFVEWEGENVNTPTEGDTRAAAEPDTDKFQISINRVSPKPEAGVVKGTYGELRDGTYGELTTKGVIELPRIMGGEDCWYEIEAYSGEMKPVAYDDEEGQPTYRGKLETPFKIEAEYNSEDSSKDMSMYEIKCSLESIMVSVSMEESMAELSKNVSFKISNSDSQELTFNDGKHHFGVARMVAIEEDPTFKEFVEGKEPSYGYLKQVNENGDDLTLSINLVYDGKPVTQSFTANPDAKAIAGQHRKILLYMISNEEEVREGHIIIGVKVETWVYGEEVVVDAVTKAVFQAEPTLPDDSNDPDAPQFDGSSFNFVDGTANVAVSADDYDKYGEYTGNTEINVTAKDAITNFTIYITSTDKAYQAELDEVGLTEGTGIDIMGPSFTRASASEALRFIKAYGFNASRIIENTANFDIKGFFTDINYYKYSGTHTITMEVTDASGHKSTNELVVTNDGSGGGSGGGSGDTGDGLTITWEGHNLNNRYDINKETTVALTISAPAGIKAFVVEIIGLDLDGTGLPNTFDLVDPNNYKLVDYNPDDLSSYEDLDKALGVEGRDGDGGLGFPVKDQVKDQTKVTFDITGFMPLLRLLGKGEYDFKMTITDNDGGYISKALLLECK